MTRETPALGPRASRTRPPASDAQPARAPTSVSGWPFPLDWRNPPVPRRLTQRERLADVPEALW